MGHCEAIEALVTLGADIDARDKVSHPTEIITERLITMYMYLVLSSSLSRRLRRIEQSNSRIVFFVCV